MADRLNAAAEGNIKILHELLQQNPRLLSQIDELPFADTPLHIAAQHGMAIFAVEIAVFHPSFTKKLNSRGRTPLHEALMRGKWETARVLAQLDTDLIRVKGAGGKTPLHVAAEIAPEQLLSELLFICPLAIQDVTAKWETAVHLAVKKKKIEQFKVLFGWIIRTDNTHIFRWKDINGDTVLHLATRAESKEAVGMLVNYVAVKSDNFNNDNSLAVFAPPDPANDQIIRAHSSFGSETMLVRLTEAAKVGNVKILHQLLQQNPRLLSQIDELPFADTPLHVAARHGKATFAVEIAVFHPSFTKKLNSKGMTPLHEALKKRNWETARVLAQLDADLIRVKGTGGKTPLHVAAEVAPPQLLSELLFICPLSIQDVTAKWETAVHRAVKKKNITGFRVLFGWMTRTDNMRVFRWKDINGDTVLHLATRARSKEMVGMLVNYVGVKFDNFKGEDSLDIADSEIRSLLVSKSRNWASNISEVRSVFRIPFSNNFGLWKCYSSGTNPFEKAMAFMGFKPAIDGDESSEKSRDIVLLVAVLIATTTYQAMLTPPGGYWQDDSSDNSTRQNKHYAGQLIMKGANLFAFVFLNSLAFCFSVAAIIISVAQLKQATLLMLATYILLLNYYTSLLLVLGQWVDGSSSWSSLTKGFSHYKFQPEKIAAAAAVEEEETIWN